MLTAHFVDDAAEMTRLVERESGVRLPNLYGDPRRELQAIFPSETTTSSSQATTATVVPPDPSLALLMPTPLDELMSVGRQVTGARAALERIRSVGLPGSVLTQPINTLSGGQRMLLALAKAQLQSERDSRLVLCGPATWLHPARRGVINATISEFEARQKPSMLFGFQGEEGLYQLPNAAPRVRQTLDPRPLPQCAWSLRSVGTVTVRPHASVLPTAADHPFVVKYSVPSELALNSPTILVGDNGVGKSVFARTLAELYAPDDGEFIVRANGISGPARVVFQDPADQIFGVAPAKRLRESLKYAEHVWEEAREVFDALQQAVQEVLLARSQELGEAGRRDTVLSARMSLVAERLVDDTPLLILDEPSWGMSRLAATALVRAICDQAHRRRKAVLLLTHQQEWWTGFSGSTLQLNEISRSESLLAVSLSGAE